jgi:hypothetical protein
MRRTSRIINRLVLSHKNERDSFRKLAECSLGRVDVVPDTSIRERSLFHGSP